MRLFIRQRRWWWVACSPDEPIAMFDMPTYVRARTRDRVIAKAVRRLGPSPSPWEDIEVVVSGTPPPEEQR
jgi:hypothetical protein